MTISILEKRALLQILTTLYKNKDKETIVSDLIKLTKGSVHTLYSSIDLLIELGLVKDEIKLEPTKTRYFTLTEKGKKVADFLTKIEEILKGG